MSRVPFDVGVKFCRKYGVEEILRPLLEFDATSSGGLHQTPTKEEANAAKRKQMYSGISSNGRQFPQDATTNLLGYSGANRFGPPLPVPSPTPSQQHQSYPSNQQYIPAHWGNNLAGQLEPPAKRHRYIEHDSTPNPSFKVENSQDLEGSSQQ